MSRFTPFLSSLYPLPLLQQRVQIVLSLARYVTLNWRDQFTGSKDHGASTFCQSVEREMACHFFNFVEVTKSARKSFTQPLDTTEHVLQVFEEAYRMNDAERIAVPHFDDKNLRTAFAEKFGGAPYHARLINCNQEEVPTVEGAFRMAENNFIQSQTRRLTLSAIYGLLKLNDFSQQLPLDCEGALLHHLYLQKELAIRDMLLFSGLLGGKVNTDTVKLVARHTCYRKDTDAVQYAVMHFINSDRRHPGMHMATTADALKADIKTKYEAL